MGHAATPDPRVSGWQRRAARSFQRQGHREGGSPEDRRHAARLRAAQRGKFKMIAPVFSHGGFDEPGYVAIAGSGVSKGRPVSSLSASQDGHVMNLVLTGTAGQTKTVKLEGHGGSVDQSGFPVESDWIDYSGGGYVMVVGGGNAPATLSKKLPRGIPYWRT